MKINKIDDVDCGFWETEQKLRKKLFDFLTAQPNHEYMNKSKWRVYDMIVEDGINDDYADVRWLRVYIDNGPLNDNSIRLDCELRYILGRKQVKVITKTITYTMQWLHLFVDVLCDINEQLIKQSVFELCTKGVDFDNEDVLITDPCYIMKKPSEDWKETDYGMEMEKVGVSKHIARNTIYGDWSCTVFDDNSDSIGEFCADSGKVAVFSLKEVLKYNPEYNVENETKHGLATVIKGFTGTVAIVEEGEGEEASVHVVGKGNINFRSEQTGG